MVVVLLMLLILCHGQTFGDFLIPTTVFTEGTIRKINRVVFSLWEEETSQGSHVKNPRQPLVWVLVSKTDGFYHHCRHEM